MESKYYLIGERPIMITHEKDALIVKKYDWMSQEFIPGLEYVKFVLFGRGEIKEYKQNDFLDELKRIKSEIKYKNINPSQYEKTMQCRKNGLKEKWRTTEKAQEDFGGNVEYVLDILSEDIILNNFNDIKDFVISLKADEDVLKIDDRFYQPLPCGYSDYLINKKLNNGAIVELKVHHKNIYELFERHNNIYKNEVSEILLNCIKNNEPSIRSKECRRVMDSFNKLQNIYFQAKKDIFN